ncbi:MAG: hypothetical protein MK132_24850 [Lentisphaerales bacterium]|nr:hypothetical protein [Lentisphaerales bacterium]
MPDNLSKAICKIMAKSPIDRVQSCEEIYDAFNRIKYAEENKGKLVGKTPINLKSVDIEKIKAISAERRAN